MLPFVGMDKEREREGFVEVFSTTGEKTMQPIMVTPDGYGDWSAA